MDESTNAKSAPGIVIVKTCSDKPPTKVAGAKDKGKEATRIEDSNDSAEDKSERKIRHQSPLPAYNSSKGGKSAHGSEGPSAASDKATACGSTHN